MTSQLLTQLLQALSLLSVLLLIGTFLRAKVKLFQSLYLPASVIGGFIGMIISPEIFGRFSNYSISEEWIKTYSLLPGILSVPIFAAIPLGMFLNENKNIKSMYPSKVLICFGLFQCASMSQSAMNCLQDLQEDMDLPLQQENCLKVSAFLNGKSLKESL